MVGYDDSYYKVLIDFELSRVYTLMEDLDKAGEYVEKGIAAIKSNTGNDAGSSYLVDAYLAQIEYLTNKTFMVKDRQSSSEEIEQLLQVSDKNIALIKLVNVEQAQDQEQEKSLIV